MEMSALKENRKVILLSIVLWLPIMMVTAGTFWLAPLITIFLFVFQRFINGTLKQKVLLSLFTVIPFAVFLNGAIFCFWLFGEQVNGFAGVALIMFWIQISLYLITVNIYAWAVHRASKSNVLK